MYAIIDIETTGGKFNEEGITEVAIYKFDGHEIVDQFISLVNPERPIQPFVVKLTGITPKMVKTAPKFYEVAKRIVEITKDCIFVAHNTSFDYRIMRTEFNRLGFDYTRKTICTVELSKELLPDQDSYSLGKLCKSLGIPMNDRHRASGDALATVKLFKLLLNKDIGKKITSSTVKTLADSQKTITANLTSIIENIPPTTGLFFVHNNEGTVLYMGKNKNIKKGINQLFLRTSKRTKTLQKQVADITYEETGNELIAQLKFDIYFQKNKPRFNGFRKKQKENITFNSDNMLVIDKGRHPNEKSVLLIQNNEIQGIGFIDLAHQLENIEIVKNLITPIENNITTRNSIKKYLDKSRVEKIIRF